MKAEWVAAVMLVASAVPATAVVVMMSSKHVFSTPFRYIGFTDISKSEGVKSYFRYIEECRDCRQSGAACAKALPIREEIARLRRLGLSPNAIRVK